MTSGNAGVLAIKGPCRTTDRKGLWVGGGGEKKSKGTSRVFIKKGVSPRNEMAVPIRATAQGQETRPMLPDNPLRFRKRGGQCLGDAHEKDELKIRTEKVNGKKTGSGGKKVACKKPKNDFEGAGEVSRVRKKTAPCEGLEKKGKKNDGHLPAPSASSEKKNPLNNPQHAEKKDRCADRLPPPVWTSPTAHHGLKSLRGGAKKKRKGAVSWLNS